MRRRAARAFTRARCSAPAPPAFVDARTRYTSFCASTTEKAVLGDVVTEIAVQQSSIARRKASALRILDAGLGDGAVACQALAGIYSADGEMPIVLLAKEVCLDDVRAAACAMAERLAENPNLVFCVTNAPYSTISEEARTRKAAIPRRTVSLRGRTAFDIRRELQEALRDVAESGAWDTRTSPRGGVLARSPLCLVFRRESAPAKAALDTVTRGPATVFDVTVSAQPFRANAPIAQRCRRVLSPLLHATASTGTMILAYAAADNPGAEIVRRAWPDAGHGGGFAEHPRLAFAELMKHVRSPGLRFHARPLPYTMVPSVREIAHPCALHVDYAARAWQCATYAAQIPISVADDRWAVHAPWLRPWIEEYATAEGGIWFSNHVMVLGHKDSDVVAFSDEPAPLR